MKKLLFSALFLAGATGASAQLADGTICPDFTGTDINSNVHNLYDYLDQGYTVVIDVSATWCGPCWSYHQSGALEDLWMNHGPAGETGVSGSTTDDVVVLWIEGDNSTGLADLQGNTGSSQGDWITGTDFPIIDNASIAQTLGIAYFPTIYTVYPDRYLEESGQGGTTYSNISSNIANHSGAVGIDGSIFSYAGETSTCSDLDVVVNVQNKGDQTMAAGATVTVMDGATVLGTGTTSQALDQFDVEQVTVNVAITGNTTLDITVAAASDVNSANDSYSQAVTVADEISTSVVTVEVTTDRYGSETTWTLEDGSGTILASGGPYSDAASNGAYPQTSATVSLAANDCFVLTVNDSYGDGMDSGYGNGFIRVVDGNGTIVEVADFADVATGNFKTGNLASVEESEILDMNVYPNPFSNIATVSFENATAVETVIEVTNMVGQIVVNEFLGEVTGTQTYELNGNNLEAGIYMVTVKAGNNVSTTRVVLSK